MTVNGTPSVGSLPPTPQTSGTLPWEQTNLSSTQATTPLKIALPSLPGIQNPFVDSSKLAITNLPQSVDLKTLTNPQTGAPVVSSNLLDVGKDIGKVSPFDNTLSINGIDQKLPTGQTLQNLQNPQTAQLSGEIGQIDRLKEQIDFQQQLNAKIPGVASKPP